MPEQRSKVTPEFGAEAIRAAPGTSPAGRRLHYPRPARAWTDAVPIGNGRLGAMCFGGVELDRTQVNDDSCWSGSPSSAEGGGRPGPGKGAAIVAAVRDAVAAGEVSRADHLIRGIQSGHSQAYQPLVDLWLSPSDPSGPSGPSDPSDYRRGLDLDRAVAWHSYRCDPSGDPARIEQESWVSAPAGVLVLRRWVAEGEGRLPPTQVRLTSPHPTAAAQATGDGIGLTVRMPSEVFPPHEDVADPVRYDPAPGAAVTAVVVLRVATDGDVVADADRLTVTDATRLVVVLATETDADPERPPHGDADALRAVAGHRLDAAFRRVTTDRGFDELRVEHVADHQALFGRVDLVLAGPEPAAPDALPIDERVRRHAAGAADPGLAALLFHYGRYLLVASSRPGSRPATLQGIWNQWVRPPWSSNYTTNINLEMNYWPAEVANLSECHEPLLRWLRLLSRRGAVVAREVYGGQGWTAHHNSDQWGFAGPIGEGDADPCWSAWPLGAAWLCRHLWDHYDYTRDVGFLRTSGWPLVRDAGEFLLGWLVELPDGTLGTCPSTSPENHYLTQDGRSVAVGASTTCDLVLIRDLLERGLDMLAALARDGGRPDGADGWRARAERALARLATERVGADGCLAEWAGDVWDTEPEHRHTSHLVGVYPLGRIDPDRAPELALAAARTLAARGPRSTGWATAWRVALHARLRDADAAARLIDLFLAPMADDDGRDEPSFGEQAGVYRNLFCAHPPFQLDGNLGVTAAVAELLLQSHTSDPEVTRVDLLPALPPSWPDGSYDGLRARGGVTVGATWAGGRAREVRLRADADRRVVVRVPAAASGPERLVTVDAPAGRPVVLAL